MMLRALMFVMALAVFSPSPSFAVEPDEILSDPALEARARELGKSLRCVVCQNQPIDESNADLARDMRILVRDRISSGDTNEQVLAYMVDRYGDFVLLDPPFKASTLVLWIGPGVIAVFGMFAVVSFYRRNKSNDDATAVAANPQTAPLSDDERKRLDALLKDDDA
ncbi:MAG: cytochrome C biogenesis protein CcmH [Rhodospirillaceae bacterium]|nr:MAG: cytochrome C biogenesis protein CcmH [Rhodospirillaceae bacterium]